MRTLIIELGSCAFIIESCIMLDKGAEFGIANWSSKLVRPSSLATKEKTSKTGLLCRNLRGLSWPSGKRILTLQA